MMKEDTIPLYLNPAVREGERDYRFLVDEGRHGRHVHALRPGVRHVIKENHSAFERLAFLIMAAGEEDGYFGRYTCMRYFLPLSEYEEIVKGVEP